MARLIGAAILCASAFAGGYCTAIPPEGYRLIVAAVICVVGFVGFVFISEAE